MSQKLGSYSDYLLPKCSMNEATNLTTILIVFCLNCATNCKTILTIFFLNAVRIEPQTCRCSPCYRLSELSSHYRCYFATYKYKMIVGYIIWPLSLIIALFVIVSVWIKGHMTGNVSICYLCTSLVHILTETTKLCNFSILMPILIDSIML